MSKNQNQVKDSKKQGSWRGMMSSDGRLHLSLDFKNLDNKEVLSMLANGIADVAKEMFERGYVPGRFMSSRDVAERFGSSRQYWEKLLTEGKIPYCQTSAGRITTDLWVAGYLKNREEVDQYVKWQKRAVKQILENPRAQHVACPKCGADELSFGFNGSETNGVCRAECGFQFTSAVSECVG